jgi:hypothetical protein
VGATACVSASNAYECVCEQLEVATHNHPQPISRAATQTKNNAFILLFAFVVTRIVVVNLRVLMTPLQNPRHRRYTYIDGALQTGELHSIVIPENGV